MLYIVFEKGFNYFEPGKRMITAMVVICCGFGNASAQERISLAAALDTAAKNNLSLKAAATDISYHKALKKTGFDPEKTSLGFEYGKFNSLANDHKFSIAQSLEFPAVYARQSAINKTNVQLSEIALQQQSLDIRTRVKLSYYGLLVLKEKEKLLLEADRVYTEFLEKSRQRYTAGDVDVLELNMAENQKLQIGNQLEMLKKDYHLLLNRFNVLLNSRLRLEPSPGAAVYSSLSLSTTEVVSNPLFRLKEQQILLSRQEMKLEKSKLLPSLNFGYNRMSIIGWQTNAIGTDQYFNGSKGFSSVSVGLGIPLFFGAQKSRIKASSVLILQKQQELEATRQQLNAELQEAHYNYEQQKKWIDSYQKKLLPNATAIIRTSTQKLNAGEIGYLDWAILVNQSIQIRSEYFNTVQQFNESAFEIERISATN